MHGASGGSVTVSVRTRMLFLITGFCVIVAEKRKQKATKTLGEKDRRLRPLYSLELLSFLPARDY